MKRVVVFGGSGFLGSYIVNELLSRNYKVTAADLHPSPYVDPSLFRQADIMDAEAVEKILAEGVDVVYNLAGFANLDKAIEFPADTVRLNVMGNLNVLEACRNTDVKHFVYASSAYAMSDKGSFYGISKLSSEKLVKEYHKRYGLDYTILRYGSVYSERAFENNYIYQLIEKALQTGEIHHSGDGEEIREYIHALDAARLSADVLENPAYKNENLMLTGSERMRRADLFEMINEILNGKLSIHLSRDGYAHHYKTTPYSFHPESSKKLVANPYIDMGQGILECIKAIRSSHE